MVPDLGGAIFFLAQLAVFGVAFILVMLVGGIASLLTPVSLLGLIAIACAVAVVASVAFSKLA